MRIIGWILFAIFAVLALITISPAAVGALPLVGDLSTVAPFTQLIAVRTPLAIALATVGILLVIIGLVRRHLIRAGMRMSLLGVVLIAVAAVHVLIVFNRGVGANEALSSDDGATATPDAPITVLTYVTGAPALTGPDAVADLVRANGADVVSLPLTTQSDVDALVANLTEGGAEYSVFTQGEPDNLVGLLVATSLGEYVVMDHGQVDAHRLMVRPATGVGPVIAAVRPVTPGNGGQDQWEREVSEAAQVCHSGSGPLIVAGNFNATVDHGPLRDLGRCADGALGADIGGVGTWPTAAPSLLGAPVDHILYDDASYEVLEGAVAEVGRANHRALIIRLEPAAAADQSPEAPSN